MMMMEQFFVVLAALMLDFLSSSSSSDIGEFFCYYPRFFSVKTFEFIILNDITSISLTVFSIFSHNISIM